MLKLFTYLTTGSVRHCSKDVFTGLVCKKYVGVPVVQCNTKKKHTDAQEKATDDDDFIPRPNVESSEDAVESIRLQKIRRAMQQHMKKLQDEASIRTEKKNEFEIGRRHLANMMGADPNTFTQTDINKAIEYLMPSGLFDPKARPVMKHPDELDPIKEGSEVDDTGRPSNTFFYTGRGNLYSILHTISSHLHELNKYEDKMIGRGFVKPPPETKIFLDDSEWIQFNSLKVMLMDEKLPQREYDYLIESLERLVEHPYSFRVKDFITKYRKSKMGLQVTSSIPPLSVGEDGIPYAEAIGHRKWTKALVTVRGKGSGKVDIDGTDISYFRLKQDREQLLFPLKFSGLLNEVDVEARLTGAGGHTAESGAIRHGLSLALCSFISPEMVEQMRIAGLTGEDLRLRERKKPGQKGARAKYKWRKR